MQEGNLHSDNRATPEVIHLQKGAQNSGEFWGKIPGFPGNPGTESRKSQGVPEITLVRSSGLFCT